MKPITMRDHLAAPSWLRSAEKPRSAEPAGSVVVVFNALLRRLEGGALGTSTVADAENVVPAPVEGETGKPEAGQHRRQKPGRADVAVHGVAMEQHRRSAGLALGQVNPTIQRQGIGRDGNEFRTHVMLSLKLCTQNPVAVPDAATWSVLRTKGYRPTLA